MATKVVDTDEVMFGALQSYLCRNVWNMPLTECRRNITLRAISNGRSCINTVNLGCMRTDLPYADDPRTKKSYFVYAAAKCCMGGLVVDTQLYKLTTDTRFQNGKQYYVNIGTTSKPVYTKASYVVGNPIKANTFFEVHPVSIANQYNGKWLPLDKFLNTRPYDLRIHGINGEWLYRNEIMIKNHPYEDMFLIAIETKMARQILGADYDFYTIYMSVYYDSDNNMQSLATTSPRISCFHPTNGDGASLNNAFQAYASLTDAQKEKTMCFINGREATPTALADMSFGQYVEIVYDPDIICNIVLDMTDPEKNNIYRSAIDSTYKYIIHIPKKYNPNNLVITHNTCDIFIRPLNTNVIQDSRLKGLFVHRFNTSTRDEDGKLIDSKITQITHNDFGISEKLLQPYMEHIGSSECAIRVVVRRHRQNYDSSVWRRLAPEANFLSMLYTFDDDKIIRMLLGNESKKLDFWRAENLEVSGYAKMLFEVPVPEEQEHIKEYIEALGYYNTLSIITPKVTRLQVDVTNTREFEVGIPISMLSCDSIGALLYINGVKLQFSEYDQYRNNQYIHFVIDEEVPFKASDKIVVELFDSPEFHCEIYSPTEGADANHTFVVNNGFDVYEVIDNVKCIDDYYTQHYIDGTTTSPIACPGAHTGYKRLNQTEYDQVIIAETQNEDGSKTLWFGADSYGRRFLICSKSLYRTFNNNDIRLTGNITLSGLEYDAAGETAYCTDLLHSGLLTISGTHWSDRSQELTIPIINKDWNVLAYLNGLELVQGTDFSYQTISAANGCTIGSTVIFNNISYLKKEDNNFELILTSDQDFMRFNGFAHAKYNENQIFQRADIEELNPYIFWYFKLCAAFADGKAVHGINEYDAMLHISDMCRQGAFYYTRGLIPLESKEFVDRYATNEKDISKLTAIAEYLRSIAPDRGSIKEVIHYSHHITSVMMNCIVKDVLTGTKVLYYESDVSRMLEQLTEYESLRKYDAGMTGSRTDLVVYNAGSAIANNTYKLSDVTAVGSDRKWYNDTVRMSIWWNPNEGYRRWEIRRVLPTSQEVYYYAVDKTGTHDPWDENLTWKQGSAGTGTKPKFQAGAFDFAYIDLFPSYSSDIHVVADDIALRQAIRAIFPADTIRDGDTTI